MLFLAILISYILMFDVVCAMFSSFQLLGLWFESIGLMEVDRTQLLLLVVVVVVVVVGLVLDARGTTSVLTGVCWRLGVWSPAIPFRFGSETLAGIFAVLGEGVARPRCSTVSVRHNCSRLPSCP